MICKSRSEQCREWQRKSRARRKAAGICNTCQRPAVEGGRWCEKCRAAKCRKNAKQREAYRVCQCCRNDTPTVPGGLCGKCCELMAKDALRLRLHSRCEDGGTLEIDLEHGERAAYRTLRSDKLSGQAVLPFARTAGVADVEPYAVPEYSRNVFADSIRWEG